MRKVEQVHYSGAVDAKHGRVNVKRTEDRIALQTISRAGTVKIELNSDEARDVADMLMEAVAADQGPLSEDEERELERLLAKAEGLEEEEEEEE